MADQDAAAPRPTPQRRSSLPRLAAVVWVAWALLLVVLQGMLRAHAWHPHFLPVTLLLLVLLLAGFLLIVIGLWRVARGPSRLATAGWLLVGMTPLWFFAAHAAYGAEMAVARMIDINPITR